MSKWLVGSSNTVRWGRRHEMSANDTRLFCPPLRVPVAHSVAQQQVAITVRSDRGHDARVARTNRLHRQVGDKSVSTQMGTQLVDFRGGERLLQQLKRRQCQVQLCRVVLQWGAHGDWATKCHGNNRARVRVWVSVSDSKPLYLCEARDSELRVSDDTTSLQEAAGTGTGTGTGTETHSH